MKKLGPGTTDLGQTRTTDPGQEHGPRTRDYRPGTTDPGPRNRDHGIGTTDLGTRNSEHRPSNMSPRTRTPDQGPRTRDPWLWTHFDNRKFSFGYCPTVEPGVPVSPLANYKYFEVQSPCRLLWTMGCNMLQHAICKYNSVVSMIFYLYYIQNTTCWIPFELFWIPMKKWM